MGKAGRDLDMSEIGKFIAFEAAISLLKERFSDYTAIGRLPGVAFEVDEIEGAFDWRSVVVHGTLYFLDEDGPVTTIELRDRAVKLLQRLVPDLGTPFDPVAHRSLVFGIHVSTYTGRASRIDG